MEKNTTFGLLFYLRKDKLNKENEAPIYVRITIDGQRTNISTNRTIKPERWNDEADKARGSNEQSQALNQYLFNFKKKIYDHHSDLLVKGKHITAESLRNSVLGIGEKKHSLIEIFEYHNQQMKEKIGIDFVKATATRYNTTLQHIRDFIKITYRSSDMHLSELNYKFISDLEHYLKTKRNCNHNTSLKYIRNFRKIINIAVANEWLDKDPFVKYKSRLEEVDFVYLTQKEIDKLKNKKISIPRLDMVRDIFVFSCYTGLAYADVKKLTPNDIVIGIDGEKWVFTYRTKTEVKSNVPLLPEALTIIEKYKNHPVSIESGKLLPVISNQRLNSYLKELADICNIHKDFTFHTARKTFGTTVLLNNDVPIESVSKMLGHSDIRTTQKSYAKVLDKKVSSDMIQLKQKLYGPKKKSRALKAV